MFVVTFDWETPTDTRPTRMNCILQDRFRDTPLDIPEKILQNAVQTRCPSVNKTSLLKVMTKSHFRPISLL